MKVLIVDDSKFIRVRVNDILQQYDKRIELFEASNGKQCLSIINDEQPEIILLDVIMYELSGIDILKKIKELIESLSVKVIMISSVDDDATLKECFKFGASDFIRKPIREIDLISRIDGAIKSVELIKNLKESNEKIVASNDELILVNQQIISAKNQLVQAEKLVGIGQLAAGVAHEINNPIGFVSSNFYTLKEYIATWFESYKEVDQLLVSSDKEVYLKFKKIIEDKLAFIIEDVPVLLDDTEIGLSRIKEIINGLRSFSRVDQSNKFSLFDVNQGIRDTLIVSKNYYSDHVKLILNLEEIPFIQAHGGKLNQVFLNLIVNATDAIIERHQYLESIGQIIIKSYQLDANVVIEIIDNGSGIKPDSLSKIFNPFYTSKPVGSGTGLGLSISYDVITNTHLGELSVSSKYGEGTSFKIVLPVDNDIEIK